MEFKGYRFELNTMQDYEFLEHLVAKEFVGKYTEDELTDWQDAFDLRKEQYRYRKGVEECVTEWRNFFKGLIIDMNYANYVANKYNKNNGMTSQEALKKVSELIRAFDAEIENVMKYNLDYISISELEDACKHLYAVYSLIGKYEGAWCDGFGETEDD